MSIHNLDMDKLECVIRDAQRYVDRGKVCSRNTVLRRIANDTSKVFERCWAAVRGCTRVDRSTHSSIEASQSGVLVEIDVFLKKFFTTKNRVTSLPTALVLDRYPYQDVFYK